ncbi:MAG TPA: ABC transporter permease [Gammaproteobacteria bacterium]
MSIILKKALSDLRLYPSRFALVAFALVIGVWGVGSILVSYYVLSRDLSQNFLNTQPAHAILTSSDFARLDLAALRSRPQIAAAEFRDYSLQRIEVAPDQWLPLWLYGVADFEQMSLARLTPEEGAMVPVPGSLLVERDALRISNFDTVRQPRVRLPQGIRTIPISGITFDPAQAPATQDHFVYAYTDQQSYAQLTGEPLNQRLLLRLHQVTAKAQLQTAVDQLVAQLAEEGIRITKIEIPEPDQHPHQWQLDTLLLLQGSISLLAFTMAAVLVSQLMASLLARQIRQIGVLKAIGASRAQVLRIYAIMVLAVGFVVSLVGVPLAVLSGYGFSYFVAYQLNFNILTTTLPGWLYAALLAVSLMLPLLLSLPALLRGTRISVRDALSDYGITAQARYPATISPWLQHLPSSLVMALRNIARQKKRLAVTVLTMALGVAIFSTGFNVRQSLAELLRETADTMRHDVRVVLKQPISMQDAAVLFHSIENIRKMETWSGGRGEIQHQRLASGRGVGITALPHDSELLQSKILQGRWLRDANAAEMVMNMQAWEGYGSPQLGSELTLVLAGRQVSLTLVGLVEEFDKPNIYLEQQVYHTRVDPEQRVNSFMFAAHDNRYDAVIQLKQAIERRLAASDLPVLEVMSHAERMKIIYDHLNIVLSVLLFFAFTVLLVSALGMASAMGIGIMERTREIGVLRAIGATPARIFKLFETEGLLISLASIVLGLLLSWPLSMVASVFFGDLMLGGASLKFVVSELGLSITLLTTLLFGWLASRIPAQSAVRISTSQALAYE